MKGVIFTEFLDLVETTFGEDMLEDMLDKAELQSGGAFTTVGNYPCEELVEMVTVLSTLSGVDGAALQRTFGAWMMDMFQREYPGFFEGKTSSLDLLEAVDREVHVEVQKLYPEAELPRFVTERPRPAELQMVYQSPRPLQHFCEGLIQASVKSFGETAEVTQRPANDASTDIVFNIALTPQPVAND